MSVPPLVILDRDGVINYDSPDFIKSLDEWIPIEGSIEAIARLSRAGIRVAIATNQSGVARGLVTEQSLAAMHAELERLVAEAGGTIAAIRYCPHGPDDGCACRKPAPGLLLQIAETLEVSLEGVPVIGDALRDLQAAMQVGALPVLVRSGKGRETEASLPEELSGVPVFDDLRAFVDELSAAEEC